MLEAIRSQGLEEEQREEMGRAPGEKVKRRTNQERQQVRL